MGTKHHFKGVGSEADRAHGEVASRAAGSNFTPAGNSHTTASFSENATGQPEPVAAKKPLRLSDNEILSLFRGAQKEASLEADWRGIQDPPARREQSDAIGSAAKLPASSASVASTAELRSSADTSS